MRTFAGLKTAKSDLNKDTESNVDAPISSIENMDSQDLYNEDADESCEKEQTETSQIF